jgi:excisionase family DNA binding protein
MGCSYGEESCAEVDGGAMGEDHMLTPKEVAEKLGRHEKTVIRWCREGYLPGKRFGKLWGVMASDLAKWMADPPPYPRRIKAQDSE